jgi:hypothetical protein
LIGNGNNAALRAFPFRLHSSDWLSVPLAPDPAKLIRGEC